MDRGEAETLAEGVAYVVPQHFGVEGNHYSLTYVAHWAKSENVLKANLATIQKAAARIIDAVESAVSDQEAA